MGSYILMVLLDESPEIFEGLFSVMLYLLVLIFNILGDVAQNQSQIERGAKHRHNFLQHQIIVLDRILPRQ